VVHQFAGIYRQKGCDAIVAVGGGSVMDTAKGVNIVVSENADDLMQFSGAGTLTRQLKPLVAIPTTAGTGSEVTLVAVIADHDAKPKNAIHFLFPSARCGCPGSSNDADPACGNYGLYGHGRADPCR
jgi:alcohol dehydrogenase